MLRRIFSFFFNRFTLVLCGLILLSLLVWFVGPLVYIQPYQPLESAAVRGWIIAAIFGIWFLRLLVRWWRAKEMNARLLGQLARIGASDASTPEAGPGKEEVAELEKRFKEAIDVLGKTRFGQTVMVYDGADRALLEPLGTVTTPTLSDLFVALMSRETGAAK